MILLLDTSTPICKLTMVDGDWKQDYEWQADRGLAKGLIGYLQQEITNNHKTWDEVDGVGVFQGPGSFTGLRIGLTVLNTLADTKNIPIVGAQGEDWQQEALDKLMVGENDKIVLPHYGSEPHITKSKK